MYFKDCRKRGIEELDKLRRISTSIYYKSSLISTEGMRRVKVHPVNWSLSQEPELVAWRKLDSTFMSYTPSNYSQLSPNTPQSTGPTERLELILSNQSLLIRATDLATFIEKCPPNALKDNYQLLVESIFANRDRDTFWDLRCMRRADYPHESAAISRLLAPDGPLITLALRLMDDHNFLLEFPLDALPPQLRHKLMERDAPSFFANKLGFLQSSGFQQNVVNLLLNPFEYFMFYFASINLLGISIGRPVDYMSGWATLQDTLYTNVLEDYLTYYFPCSGTGVPSHNFNYCAQQAKEAVFMSNSMLRQTPSKPKLGYNTTQEHQDSNLPKLFKPSVLNLLQDQSGSGGSRDNLYLTTHPSAYKEVWRSETMLQVFMELWMCGHHQLDKIEDFNNSSPMMYGGLPSVEVVKSIRTMVRHLHYFINCLNSHAMHPMEDIKRTTYPVFQRKLYTFLRYLFHHWPLDNSFRIVYETWLSYIQPWRYTNLERLKGTQIRGEMSDIPVDRRWFNFLLDNILFYSKILSQMLTRLERVDLTATKNALMFYRLAKVYTSQESLKLMLQEIEQGIQSCEEQSSSSTSNSNLRFVNIKSPRPAGYSTPATTLGTGTIGGYFGKMSPITSSPATSPSFNQQEYTGPKFAHLRQLMKDFENYNFIYQPIFSAENICKIRYLINSSAEARNYLYESANQILGKKKSSGFINSVVQFFWSESAAENQMATFNANEKTKAGNQLEFAKNQFAMLFNIPLPENDGAGTPPMNGSSPGDALSYGSMFSTDASPYTNGIYKGSSFGIAQPSKCMLPSDVLVDNDSIPYGNPDTILVRKDENRRLVWLFLSISSYLNKVLGDYIEAAYFSDTWGGRYIRAMLSEPTEYLVSEKLPCLGEYRNLKKTIKVARYLPPRINLRFFGLHQFWMWIFIALILALILNLTIGGSLLAFSLLYLIYLTFRVTSEPMNKLEELRQLKMQYTITEENKVVPQASTSFRASNQPNTIETSQEDGLFLHRRSVRFEGSGDSLIDH